jgi:predicted ester cyclase
MATPAGSDANKDLVRAYTIPATGRRVRWDAVDVYRVANDRIVEEWAGDDLLAILVNLGAYTPPWLGGRP